MKEHSRPNVIRLRRSRLAPVVGAIVLLSAGAVLSRSRPSPVAPAFLQVHNAPWSVGEDARLAVQSEEHRAGQVVLLTLLAPGSGQPQIEGLDPAFFGLSGVQLLWLPEEHRETEVMLAAATGARYISLDFDWRRLEPRPGRYAWKETDEIVALAKRYGLRLVPMLLYTPRWASTAAYAPLDYHRAPPIDDDAYRDFVYAVVNRYKPYGASSLTSDGYGITEWAIWNEPNVRSQGEAPEPGEFWTGDIEEYVRLLRAGYEGAHAADPGCSVLNGALADVFWAEGESDLITALERFYDPDGDGDARDGGRPFFDVLNVHTYQLDTPEAAWYEARLEALLQVMRRFGDEQKPIWITETGYGSTSISSADSSLIHERAQAEAVRMVYRVCSRYPQVERVFWWNLRDYHSQAAASNEAMEAHYGLLQADWTPKPSFAAYSQLTGSVGQVLTRIVVTDEGGMAGADIPAHFFDRPGAYVVFAKLYGRTPTLVFKHDVPHGRKVDGNEQ